MSRPVLGGRLIRECWRHAFQHNALDRAHTLEKDALHSAYPPLDRFNDGQLIDNRSIYRSIDAIVEPDRNLPNAAYVLMRFCLIETSNLDPLANMFAREYSVRY
jgi:hypothetical protein